ncbi:AMP-binding protein [Aromatoleum bremense]|nr:AMP-binding protein [Aromatoleum bremense]QTQ34175.1 AMP-dependent synthetase/ligase [Aromatoleum bremense]
MHKFNTDLEKCQANFQALTPIRFLTRAAEVFPDRTAVIYKDRRYTWAEYSDRCHKLARALIASGVERGNTVAIMAPNVPAMVEAQFGVPLSGGVINCINIRLDAAAVAFILEHSETKVMLVDQQFAKVARDAIALSGMPIPVIDIADSDAGSTDLIGKIEYEDFLESAPRTVSVRYPEEEWEAIALNYTSGTTGNPKGVVYHHRGAYLNSLGQIINAELAGRRPVYLWTLPLFHCNGWCYAWALAAVGGTHVCLRKAAASDIFAAIEQHQVTHFCSAPTVLNFLIAGKPASWKAPDEPIKVVCAGASPPVSVLQQVVEMGFSVLHVYGMTEMHGITTLCQSQESWEGLDLTERMGRLGRQGVRTVVADEMIVCAPDSYESVPRDGKTIGEVMFRGNLAMKGYLKNPAATREAFADGWYHTGDLAVMHEDGYIEIKDRSKDIIISGGENVSSLELEDVLYTLPAIAEVAVVAVPDEKWGEVPCAIIDLRPEHVGKVSEQDVIQFCRTKLPGFKVPRHIIFEPITRTATGKLQKFKLRAHAAEVISARKA